MKCINCQKDSKIKICEKCQFDSDIMMSRTQVKNKFKLSDEELDDNYKKLNYIDFATRYYSGRKYLISDIVKLAQDLLNNPNTTDKQRTAFTKQIEIHNKYISKEKEFTMNIRYIKNYLSDILHKSDLGTDCKDYIENVVENNMEEEINQHLNTPNVDITLISLKLIPTAESKIKLSRRKADIDNQIEKQFKFKKDQKKAKVHKLYNQYINKNISNINDICNTIKLEIDKENDYGKRQRQLTKEITTNIPKKYHSLILKDDLCEEFYKNGSKDQLVMFVDKLKEKVNILNK